MTELSRPRLRVGTLLSISTDKWQSRWREQHPKTSLEWQRESDDDQARQLLVDNVVSGALDAALIRLNPHESPSDLTATALHCITLYEEGMAVLISSEHPLADEAEIDGALLDDLDLSAALLPAPVARDALQKSLVAVPVTGLEPPRIVCIWRVDRDADDIQDFVGILRGRTGHSSRTQAQ